EGMKVSGNAQQRKRGYLLHHGTILYDFDIGQVDRYLQMPPRQPDYRSGRGHTAFIRNLPNNARDLKRRLREVWNADQETTLWPCGLTSKLAMEKYSTNAWIQKF